MKGKRAPSNAADAWQDKAVRVSDPSVRRLRGYAFDPSLSNRLETTEMNNAVYEVPWEKLTPGPSGAYVEVIDHDPASECLYAPVDLDDPRLLASDGLAPSEGNPRFHQQMVYAVAMRTIRNFETATGRPALWSPRMDGPKEAGYVGKLRIYPHGLRDQNAYYNPVKKALLFGYFRTDQKLPLEGQFPGGMIFTCLSHDIVAHEMTHALLDGMHRRFNVGTNPDQVAFHEAFADLVAMLQRFSMPDVLRHQIARTRGNLRMQNLLGELALEFGQALGLHGSLRSAIGEIDPLTQQWASAKPDPNAYRNITEPHERGALLVAAVFDAFLAIYEQRSADLLRIASSGTGQIPDGAIHPDLVGRLADEAAKVAAHVLQMCIRALDYCPPVDLTFGEYVRALITADFELAAHHAPGYRVAFTEAFRRRGIFADGVRTMSADALRWRSAAEDGYEYLLKPIFEELAKVSIAHREQHGGGGERSWRICCMSGCRPSIRVRLSKRSRHCGRATNQFSDRGSLRS